MEHERRVCRVVINDIKCKLSSSYALPLSPQWIRNSRGDFFPFSHEIPLGPSSPTTPSGHCVFIRLYTPHHADSVLSLARGSRGLVPSFRVRTRSEQQCRLCAHEESTVLAESVLFLAFAFVYESHAISQTRRDCNCSFVTVPVMFLSLNTDDLVAEWSRLWKYNTVSSVLHVRVIFAGLCGREENKRWRRMIATSNRRRWIWWENLLD